MSSKEHREAVLERLITDLLGPHDPEEVLIARPTDVYATGILWPQNIAFDPDDDDRLGVEGDSGADGDTPSDEAEVVPAMSLRRPSAAGISFAVSAPGDPEVSISVKFAVYEPERNEERRSAWRRHSIEFEKEITIGLQPQSIPVVASHVPAGVTLHVRAIRISRGRLVTVTLINASSPEGGREETEAATLFQTNIKVCPAGSTTLIARPSRRAEVDDDDRSTALLYRNASEFAAGHTCSANWEMADSGIAAFVESSWVPTASVPAVDPDGHEIFKELAQSSRVFDAEWLSQAPIEDVIANLALLPQCYGDWIALQEAKIPTLGDEYVSAAKRNILACRDVVRRMNEGVRRLRSDPVVGRAFQLANRAMVIQYQWDARKAARGPLTWRPFQLGFLLLTAESAVDPGSLDRKVMDLLWFPTGGGKTEAYLSLIAFIAFHRRLAVANPDEGDGVAAVMRYTLRLLTTQQFSRAAALMLACETIRWSTEDLGSRPFSIGLWVGRDATPNTRREAYAALRSGEGASPKQLSSCPSCAARLDWEQERPDASVQVWCRTSDCVLGRRQAPLPIWTVDEDIYDVRPTLLIGTVDKFAQIVRAQPVNHLFGLSDGHVPSLIIQDELHLISGPLGTLTGLYETAFDIMLSARGDVPKVIGSTATIRRAPDQVLALFDRATCLFPPPAVDHDDSGFAVTDLEAPGRQYVGIASAGRSAKFTLQATAASLLQSGGIENHNSDAADPYWTMVAYFNSLRELGGSLVLMQDDVNDSLQVLSTLRGETARRPTNIEELTSRRTQNEVREMLDLLAIPAGRIDALDVVLATNMLSVGVDIPRLGLMLVYGQPKGIAEYIQATSRVGRGHVPGLVISVFNSAKARDRSHFETFKTWHSTLYRDVEATSVTPFASRARDRALHAVLVTVVRHLIPGMLSQPVLDAEAEQQARGWIEMISARAKRIDPAEVTVTGELLDRLTTWLNRRPNVYWHEYKPRESLLQSAERAATEAHRTVSLYQGAFRG